MTETFRSSGAAGGAARNLQTYRSYRTAVQTQFAPNQPLCTYPTPLTRQLSNARNSPDSLSSLNSPRDEGCMVLRQWITSVSSYRPHPEPSLAKFSCDISGSVEALPVHLIKPSIVLRRFPERDDPSSQNRLFRVLFLFDQDGPILALREPSSMAPGLDLARLRDVKHENPSWFERTVHPAKESCQRRGAGARVKRVIQAFAYRCDCAARGDACLKQRFHAERGRRRSLASNPYHRLRYVYSQDFIFRAH